MVGANAAADAVGGFEDLEGNTFFLELAGAGEAGQTCANDENIRAGRHSSLYLNEMERGAPRLQRPMGYREARGGDCASGRKDSRGGSRKETDGGVKPPLQGAGRIFLYVGVEGEFAGGVFGAHVAD